MKIKPCSFCGYLKPYFYGEWRVECGRCGCNHYGPVASNEADAIKWWHEAPQSREINWARRVNAERKREARERKRQVQQRALEQAPQRKRDREYKRWAAERAAWLRAPVQVNDG